MSGRLCFAVLGPVRAWRDATELPLGPPQQRAVLSALLLRGDAQVSAGELISAVWGSEPPSSALRVIRTYIYQLRRVLAPPGAVIDSVGKGYVLRVSPEDLDLAVFRRQLACAEAARSAGDHATVAAHLRDALGMWHGAALAGVPGAYAEAQRARLELLRLAAIEERIAAELRLGSLAETVAELTELVAGHPLDERFREMLMLALYRSGRQAEALAVYRRGRVVLTDELGIDPGPGLRTVHERILRADPTLLAARPDTTARPDATARPCSARPVDVPDLVVPSQLGADQRGFTGRRSEVAALLDLLPAGDTSAAAAEVIAVGGMPGVGKTALAVHAAHRMAHRFPGGQLFLNLRGFDHRVTATDPGTALRVLLESLGVPPARIPAGPEARARLYRGVLSDRRVLVLLDNARDADQVRPLLPGTPGSLVLVTSRCRLAGLVADEGAHPLTLEPLSDSDARELLTRRLGRGRTSAEVPAVQEIVTRCGRLPLALAVTAANAALNPTFPLAAIAADLDRSHRSLDAFGAVDDTHGVRAVFSWSYRTLSRSGARMFRLLSLHPGPDISLLAAASLAGTGARHARLLTSELTRGCLLTEHAPGRFTLHGLLRRYAAELVDEHETPRERSAARLRSLGHYLHSAAAARAHCGTPFEPPLPGAEPGTAVAEFADRRQALEWLAREHAVLPELVRQAAAEGHLLYARQLARCLDGFFLRQRGLVAGRPPPTA
ncbi:BTAD domain-containing putative transcriptional regulator [Streptomyces sp. NPDC057900]|uniref:AfsR/SARP family transcriptional regulator n=1 Tax=Streptomyces sp. NPDC057900 TaxID=3346274 RepID=UPI0036E2E613